MGLKNMKSRNFLLGFFVLSIIAISAMLSANAAVYAIGVKADDSFTYQITTVDEAGLEAVFGTNWASDMGSSSVKGAKAKYLITKVEDLTTYWKLTVSYWDLTTADFAEFPDSSGSMWVYKDPDDASGFGLVCPTPVSSYLAVIAGKYPTFLTADENTLTIDTGYPSGFKMSYTYDSGDGALSSMKYIYTGKTIWEMSRSGIIPGYELTILLGVSAITTVGLIYIQMKKK